MDATEDNLKVEKAMVDLVNAARREEKCYRAVSNNLFRPKLTGERLATCDTTVQNLCVRFTHQA